MAQLLGPDDNTRLVYRVTGSDLRATAGETALVYTDAAGTILAAINTWDGTGTPAGLIAGSLVTIDAYSKLPLFWFPNGVDVLYVKVGTGPVSPINANYDPRLDALEADVTAIENAAIVAIAASGASTTVDLSLGSTFVLTVSANTQITFTGAVAAQSRAAQVYIVMNGVGGWVVSWAASTKWPGGGSGPVPTSTANAIDLYTVDSINGGTTYLATLAGQDIK